MNGGPSAVLLAGLGLVLLAGWRDGRLDLYVHPSFVPVLAATGAALVLLAVVQLLRLVRWAAAGGQARADHRSAWGVALVAMVVVVAALAPPRPLGSLVAEGQAAELLPPPEFTPGDETEAWSLLDWARALNGGVQRERLIGRRVSVVGFVHRPRRGPLVGETLVTRFVVRCCAADGLAVSLPIRHPEAPNLPPDAWVRVDGVVRLAEIDGVARPYADADRLAIVAAPEAPYLTP